MAELTIQRKDLDAFFKALGVDTQVLLIPENSTTQVAETLSEATVESVTTPPPPEIPEMVALPENIVLMLSEYAEKCRKSIKQFEDNERETTPNAEKWHQELVMLQKRQAELRLLLLENENNILKTELALQKNANAKQIYFTQSQNVKSMLAGYEFGVKDALLRTGYPKLKDYITYLDPTKTKVIVKK